MDTKTLTRLMIDTAVRKGIEDMTDDPRRSLRKLADMGEQFSTGGFQKEIIAIIQTILENEQSPYYTMLDHFLADTDHDCIRKIGINLGYNSWTYGARLLNSSSQKLGVAIPWILIFKYDPNEPNGITPDDIRSRIEEALPYGIYAFAILQKSGRIASDDIINIFADYDECGFFYFLEKAEVTASQMNELKRCQNALISINIDTPGSKETCSILHDARLLYCVHHFYHNEASERKVTPDEAIPYLDRKASLIFFIQADDCSINLGDTIKNVRMRAEYPLFVFDLYNDIRLTSEIITGNKDALIEFETDGTISKPSSSGINIKNKSITLNDIFLSCMPGYNKVS